MAKKEKPGVLLYWDTFDILEKARGEKVKTLLKAIRNFAQYGEVPDFGDDEALELAWPGIQYKLIADDKKYEDKIEQKREAGRKGGLARASKSKQKQANEADAIPDKRIKPNTDTNTNTDTITNTNSVADKPPRPRFIPPTVEEVREYCLSRNNNVDPARFVAYYESIGWMVGRNKMKSWKSAVHTWERSEYNKATEVVNGRTKADTKESNWSIPNQLVF